MKSVIMPGVTVKRRRGYVKAARATAEAETRDHIVDAVVALHEEVGPLRTTVKAIAERAGVQRLTVYRHFPSDRELIAACSARWAEQQPPPDLSTSATGDPRLRARKLLIALYRYYRGGERMLSNVIADARRMPLLRKQLAPFADYLDKLVAEMERGWRGRSARRRTTLRHAVQFATWQSLTALTAGDAEAADLVMRWCDRASP
jgi:AcrR family transcriptional regulator